MKTREILAICLSALLLATAGCSASDGERASSTITGSAANGPSSDVSGSAVPVSSAAASGANSEPVSGNGETGSESSVGEGTASAVQPSSEGSPENGEWIAYDTNQDGYKLHIKKKDGTEDKVIVDDMVIAPCVAGDWVYFLSDLSTIEKVRLDGSQRTKVCGTDAMQHLNGNMSITAEYKNGSVLYRTQQLHEVGNNSSYPAHYYKLDPDTNEITEVKAN